MPLITNPKSAAVNSELISFYIHKKEDFLRNLTSLPDCLEISYSDGVYFGQVSNHKIRNGRGVFNYYNGDLYFGGWKSELFDG
jgi:hypothetical protein